MPALTEADIEAVASLFGAYAASLPIDLGYQDFEAELADLPGKYASPKGALLLARDGADEPIGCVALRPLAEEGVCEMKRLYIAPAARGSGLGGALSRAVIEQARALGYSQMRLDTLQTMTAAVGLYERLGFRRCSAYYEPTPPGTIFMAVDL